MSGHAVSLEIEHTLAKHDGFIQAPSVAHVLVGAAGRTAFDMPSSESCRRGAVIFDAASANEMPRIGEERGGLPRPDDALHLDLAATQRMVYPSGVAQRGVSRRTSCS